jgi:uncharacterized membrane protein YeaQ/YmgE (transglycosylase-associated protein family)
VRATLHDELMRKAGFAVEGDAERADRRKRRRAITFEIVGFVGALAGTVVFAEELFHAGALEFVLPAALLVSVLGGVAVLLMDRLWLNKREDGD